MSTPHVLSQPLASLPDPLPIPTIAAGTKPFDVAIRPPGSKSITNRALLLAALADGTSTLRGALVDADDAQVMIRALQQLGAKIEFEAAPSASSVAPGSSPAGAAPAVLRITGVNGSWRNSGDVTLNLHNAGTATRFLAAAAMLSGALHRTQPETRGHAPITAGSHAPIVIDGDDRMRKRPIGELVNALRELHAQVDYLSEDGYPPIRIHPREYWMDDESVTFGRTASSQFISAVLLIAPWFPFGLTVHFGRGITSEPYVAMTIEMLRRLNVPVVDERPKRICIGSLRSPDDRPLPELGVGVKGFDLDIEPDASGATYFQAAAALFPGARITIPGLDLGPKGSLQGDTQFVRILTAMGAQVERVGAGGGGKTAGLRITGPTHLLPIDADLSDMPDTAMTAAVLACFAKPAPGNPHGSATSTLRGLRTLRVKETDRLAALQTELTKLGARVEIFRDGDDEALRITPPPPSSLRRSGGGVGPSLVFDTYNDHRMAMALALIGLRVPGVQIKNPGCVAKTYPGFWKDFAALV